MRATIFTKYILIGLMASVVPIHNTRSHEIAFIAGDGYTPSDISIGSYLKDGTVITVDNATLILLTEIFYREGGGCINWIILRGKQYIAKDTRNSDCKDSGTAQPLKAAMGGESIVGHYSRLFSYSDPNADGASDPSEFKILLDDLRKNGLKKHARKSEAANSIRNLK